MFSLPSSFKEVLLSIAKFAKYFNYEPGFNGAFLRHNLPRIKDGAYVINLLDKAKIGFHYLLKDIRPCSLIILELNRFHNSIRTVKQNQR